jgi:hypothetical protein
MSDLNIMVHIRLYSANTNTTLACLFCLIFDF